MVIGQEYFDADEDLKRGYGDYLGSEPFSSDEAPEWIAGWRTAKEDAERRSAHT
jgi:ribosome modulation factor